MKKMLLLFAVLLTTHLTVLAQSTGDLSADSKENKKTTKVKKSAQRDRDYWQDKRTVKKFQKSTKKKDCDCPGQMTAKQRRKHRFKG